MLGNRLTVGRLVVWLALCSVTSLTNAQVRQTQYLQTQGQQAAGGSSQIRRTAQQVPATSDLFTRPAAPVQQRVEVVHELPQAATPPGVSMQTSDNAVNLNARGADLAALLQMIAEYHHLNLVLGKEVQGTVTVSLQSAELDEVLDAILTVNGMTWHRRGNVLYVTAVREGDTMDPRVQGREVRVFPLSFVSATEVEKVVTGLLSPVGKVFISESSTTDQLRTQETLVIEDLPGHVQRIEEYLTQIDQPPRQVLIEAHILQIALTDTLKHGINLKALARSAGARVTFETKGMADTAGPGLALGVDGTDLDSVIQLMQTYGNTRTLASPKVLVVNRQEAKIQIGSQLGYFVTTTTMTSTLQSVQFLDIGVVLTVTPTISSDGRIMMLVRPKVSGGRINPVSGLPEEDTTEVNTTVMLPDGGGIIIGGLIKENNDRQRSEVPGFSKLPLIGGLFKRHANENRRDEIVIALVAHIINDPCQMREHELQELNQTLPAYSAVELRQP